ncbi:tetratricopeptide repeat protein [Aureivirga sp. CE67]|uniref:tetratricopeptide repeat protein n=1 Tax=Aureivirga sp. CE67 TaxID=1788983 RepID=UPI0018C96B2E|nr:tetratricopeptide repeat protein [Aureivirga sp. CE67]
MKKIILSFVFIFFLQNFMFGKSACELIKSASISYCENDLKNSIKHLEEFVENYPNHELCEEALSKIGDLYFELNTFDKAESIYHSILENQENIFQEKTEKENCYNFLINQDCNKIIYPKEYNQLKHFALVKLAEINYQKGAYLKALDFLEQSENNFPYLTNCGTGEMERQAQNTLMYHEIYMKLGKNNLALNKLLEQVFNYQDSNIQIELKKLLKEKYTEEEITSEIEKSIKNIKTRPENSINNRKYIVFFDTKIDIPFYFDEIDNTKSLDQKIKRHFDFIID